MKTFKILAFILAIVMIFTTFTSCDIISKLKDGVDEVISEKNNESEVDEDYEESELEADEDYEELELEDSKNTYSKMPDALKAKKINSVGSAEYYVEEITEGGLYYQDENDKYGIITLDGEEDTGSKYTLCDTVGKYFKVTTSSNLDHEDVDSLNCVGMVDARGKEIIPMKYAAIDAIDSAGSYEDSNRYFRVCEVTEQTTDKDEALVYYQANSLLISLGPSDEDLLYKGNWYIFDAVQGKILEGITGTNSYRQTAYGNFVKYVTDDEEQIIVNADGETPPADATMFDNGYYIVESDNVGTVYDSNNDKLFTYNMTDFIPTRSENEYIVGYKSVNDETKYVLIDSEGNIISAEFNESPYLYGDLASVENKLYDLDGNLVIDGTHDSVSFDDHTCNAWILKKDSTYTMIMKDGTILYQGKEKDSINIDTNNFTIHDSNKKMHYSLVSGDFDIKSDYSNSVAPWLVKTEGANDTYNIVDTISGETLISGYANYHCGKVTGSAIYVFAKKVNGNFDVFVVK